MVSAELSMKKVLSRVLGTVSRKARCLKKYPQKQDIFAKYYLESGVA